MRKAAKRFGVKVVASLKDLAAHGTTTVEAKSGYGLSVESELKSSQAISQAASGGQERWSQPCSAPTWSRKD